MLNSEVEWRMTLRRTRESLDRSIDSIAHRVDPRFAACLNAGCWNSPGGIAEALLRAVAAPPQIWPLAAHFAQNQFGIEGTVRVSSRPSCGRSMHLQTSEFSARGVCVEMVSFLG